MCTCPSLMKIFSGRLVFSWIWILMILSNTIDGHYCPSIYTVSFGSDIEIQCNNSYLIFHERNNEGLNWKFVDERSNCNQYGRQEGYVNQCGIIRLNSTYLKVELKSLETRETACIYCPINYKPIQPLISVTQLDDRQHTTYTFNITAAGLIYNESFEILWAKRVNDALRHSSNYWFLPGCIDSSMNSFTNPRTIVFSVEDLDIHRVEFIIRRCRGICRQYRRCNEHQFEEEINSNYFQTPDSIEKISCDSNCLKGMSATPIPITIVHPSVTLSTNSTSITTPLSPERKIKLILIATCIGLVLIISLMILIRCLVHKPKNVHSIRFL